MAYRMTEISEKTSVGQMQNGDFEIEVWDEEDPDKESQTIYVPSEDAEAVAKYILQRS
jgi:hypothetical protein